MSLESQRQKITINATA